MEGYVCVHGHFYQPPRENPWLDMVEVQESAFPYHDWNERVTDECYAPNVGARVLDGQDRVVRVVNNYARISFNVGPTLLAWLEANDRHTYRAILAADQESQRRFSGHGSALAQAYNHIIMPLANERDRLTQVEWGLRDFRRRFGREPEGMWLPEAAVDTPTLDLLAQHGVRFTILAPSQAARFRPLRSASWQNVPGGSIPTTRPYRVSLPSGRSIAVFFYNGPISQAVAFEELLLTGERFAERLLSAFDRTDPAPQLVHIATDGETYGHHHRFGEMALAHALAYIEQHQLARITNYGEYLEHHPPAHEAEIIERTSWSCAHGVGRWERHCGCSDGGHPDWRQDWRAPLRESLNWLRDQAAARYEEASHPLLREPWAARDASIDVLLDRSPATVDAFLAEHGRGALTPEQRVRALALLEQQRHAMLMFSSDAWFFDDLARVEPVQALRSAARVAELTHGLTGDDLEPGFIQRLAAARSNDAAEGGGRDIYERHVRPAMADRTRVATDCVIGALVSGSITAPPAYEVRLEPTASADAYGVRFTVGLAHLVSRLTTESSTLSYASLHAGGFALWCRTASDPAAAASPHVREARRLVDAGNIRAAVGLLTASFPGNDATVADLLPDSRERVLDALAVSAAAGLAEGVARRFLSRSGGQAPRAARPGLQLMANAHLRTLARATNPDVEALRTAIAEAAGTQLALDTEHLGYLLSRRLAEAVERLEASPADPEHLAAATRLAQAVANLPFSVDRWRAQDVLLHTVLAGNGTHLMPRFQALADALGVRVG